MTEPTAETSPSSVTPADAEVTSTPVEATTDVAAESSTASDAKEAQPTSLLDVVRNVVEPKNEDTGSEASSAAAAEKPAQGDPEAPPELTDAELAELPFHNHPRFKELVTQRNGLKTELETTTARLREYEEPARQWTQVRSFMEHNSLSDADMLDGFKMMAAIRTDPLQGRAMLAEYLTEFDKALGLVLPDDLREDVESGYLSEERAHELARARAETTGFQLAERERQEAVQRDERTRTANETADRLTSTAESWETAKRARDPDFEAKADLIADRMRAIAMAERIQPRNEAELTALLDRAHTDVTAHLRRFVPQPKSVNRPTTSSPATVAAPMPKSLREAIALAARGI